MMVLYHLHNPDAPAFSCSCNKCGAEIEPGQGFRCATCQDFDMCGACKAAYGHQHPLVVRALRGLPTSLLSHRSTTRSARCWLGQPYVRKTHDQQPWQVAQCCNAAPAGCQGWHASRAASVALMAPVGNNSAATDTDKSVTSAEKLSALQSTAGRGVPALLRPVLGAVVGSPRLTTSANHVAYLGARAQCCRGCACALRRRVTR